MFSYDSLPFVKFGYLHKQARKSKRNVNMCIECNYVYRSKIINFFYFKVFFIGYLCILGGESSLIFFCVILFLYYSIVPNKDKIGEKKVVCFFFVFFVFFLYFFLFFFCFWRKFCFCSVCVICVLIKIIIIEEKNVQATFTKV